jgi:hypothetical protein
LEKIIEVRVRGQIGMTSTVANHLLHMHNLYSLVPSRISAKPGRRAWCTRSENWYVRSNEHTVYSDRVERISSSGSLGKTRFGRSTCTTISILWPPRVSFQHCVPVVLAMLRCVV